MNDLKYWVALSGIPHLGSARLRRLESYFGTMEDAWRAGVSQLREAGLDSRTAQEVALARQGTDPMKGWRHWSGPGVKTQQLEL